MTQDVNEKKPNRMDRRRLETRQKLLTATLKSVIERGIDKTTMDAITDTADLGRRTLYYHFASKEACIVAAVAQVYEIHTASMNSIAADTEDAAQLIAASVQVVVRGLLNEPVTQHLVEHPKLLAAALAQATNSFANRDVQIGVAQKRFRPTVSTRLRENMFLWSLVGLLTELIERPKETKAMVQDYAKMYLMALGVTASDAQELVIVGEKAVPKRKKPK